MGRKTGAKIRLLQEGAGEELDEDSYVLSCVMNYLLFFVDTIENVKGRLDSVILMVQAEIIIRDILQFFNDLVAEGKADPADRPRVPKITFFFMDISLATTIRDHISHSEPAGEMLMGEALSTHHYILGKRASPSLATLLLKRRTTVVAVSELR